MYFLRVGALYWCREAISYDTTSPDLQMTVITDYFLSFPKSVFMNLPIAISFAILLETPSSISASRIARIRLPGALIGNSSPLTG